MLLFRTANVYRTGGSNIISVGSGLAAPTAPDWNVLLPGTRQGPVPEAPVVDAGTAALDGQSSLTSAASVTPNMIANSGVEEDSTGWGALVYPSLTRTNAQAHSSTWSMTGTTNATTVSPGAIITATRAVVSPSTSYDVSFWVYDATVTHLWKTRIDWYDSGGTYISTSSFGAGQTSTLNTWVQVGHTSTSPANAASAKPYINVSSGNAITVGETTYFDDAYFAKSTITGSASLSGQSTLTLVRPTNDNILDGESVEETANNWGANAASATSRDTTQAHTGAASFKTTADGTASYGVYVGMLPFASRPTVTPGVMYEFSVWVKEGTRAQSQKARIEWRDSAGVLSNSMGTSAATTTSGWTKLSVSGIAPAGSDRAGLACYTPSGANATAGDVSYWDDAYFRILPNANLTADSTLTATAASGSTQSGSATLTGESTLTSDGTNVILGSAAESGQSTLTSATLRIAVSNASLTGQSTLTSAGTNVIVAASANTGQSTLTGAGVRIQFGAAALTGQSTLTSTAVVIQPGATALTAQSILSATAILGAFGAALTSGLSTLTASLGSITTAAAALTGQSTFTSAGSRIAVCASSITGQSTFTSGATVVKIGASANTGQSTLTSGATVFKLGASALTGQSTCTSTATARLVGASALTFQSTLTGAGAKATTAGCSLVSNSTLTSGAESYTPVVEQWGFLFI